jgi:hypothetical protein
MKKLLLVAAVAGFAMTSCKKDYTCTCKVTDNGTVLSESKYTAKLKKSEAESWCSGNATSGTLKAECTLD